MSELAEQAHAAVLLADYASADAAGKINALGLNWKLTGLGAAGRTAGQAVVVLVDVPRRFGGEQCALELCLVGLADGQPVQVPGPSGEPETLRVAQLSKVDPPNVPAAFLPDGVPCTVQWIVGFLGGLPLVPGRLYAWQLSIDGLARPDWRAVFALSQGQPPPVIG